MPSRTSPKKKSLAAKSAELAMAVPQVVAHRVARMAMAGPNPSARDRKEFDLMVAEKKTAFTQAWTAMAIQTVHANQLLAASIMRAAWSPASWGKPAASKLTAQARKAALGVLDKGLGPVHRKAVANAKRLSRTKLK